MFQKDCLIIFQIIFGINGESILDIAFISGQIQLVQYLLSLKNLDSKKLLKILFKILIIQSYLVHVVLEI